MTNVANIFGNRGDYDKSDVLSIRTMKECVHCYRMRLLDMHLYINIWNYDERRKKNIPTIEGYQVDVYLKKCITLCQINKNGVREKVIKNQFKEILSFQN